MIHPSKLVAHRGLSGKVPREHSPCLSSRAIEAGALFIELDVQFSGDQLPVIYHDSDLQRVSGQSGSVLTLPRAELLGCARPMSPSGWVTALSLRQISPLEALVDILVAQSAGQCLC